MSFDPTIIVVIILISLQVVSFYPLIKSARHHSAPGFSHNSISVYEIVMLAKSPEDRIERIEKFYEWKHENTKTFIKGIGALITGNFAIIADLVIKSEKTPNLNWPQFLIIVTTAFLLIVILFLVIRLRKIAEEYKVSILIFNSLR